MILYMLYQSNVFVLLDIWFTQKKYIYICGMEGSQNEDSHAKERENIISDDVQKAIASQLVSGTMGEYGEYLRSSSI